MIGDKASDIELGARCGMTTVLVASGGAADAACRPDAVVADLREAAAWLASRGLPKRGPVSRRGAAGHPASGTSP